MDEYIKREDALKAIKHLPNVCGCSAIDSTDAEDAIMDCPTADVVPKSEVEYWQDAAANARREILFEIERLALSKIQEDVEVTMLKDPYYIEALNELMIKYGVTDKDVGCKKEEKE